MSHKPVFLNTEQQLALEVDGFVKVPLFGKSEVESLLAAFERTEKDAPNAPFYTSHWSESMDHRKEVDSLVRPILSNSILPLLDNYKDVFGYFLVKNPTAQSFFRLHQDWSLVDESKYVGITAWCALADTNATNGAFHVVKGSHRFLPNVRGLNIELAYRDILSYIEPQFTTPVYLKAGEAILFDQRLWHYSPPNISDQKRVSVALVCIPEQATLMHYVGHGKPSDAVIDVDAYQVPDDFLQSHKVGTIPTEAKKTGSFKQNVQQLRAVDFDALNKDGYRAPRAAFRNKVLEEEFFENGFFKAPLLTQEQVRSCLEIFKEVDIQQRQGKYNSLEIVLGGHRKIVQQAIEEIIGGTILEKLADYKFVGFNLAVKRTLGDTEFHAHIDDIHVNEALGNSVNCWIPLVDVNETNGALYFVPRSHKLSQPIRGIGLPFAFENKLELIRKHKQTISLKAGEALFFHTKMIHGSGFNNSGIDRPAIISGTIPSEAQPIVFMRHDEIRLDQVEKFVAPPEFYTSMEIGKRPKGFQSLGVYDYMPIEVSDQQFLQTISS